MRSFLASVIRNIQSLWHQQKRSTDAKNTAMVQRVGRNLANAVETYLRNNGYANEINNFKWEFNLVQDKQANAFVCLEVR